MGIFVTFSGKTPAKSSCNRIVVASSNYPWVRGEGDKSRKKLWEDFKNFLFLLDTFPLHVTRYQRIHTTIHKSDPIRVYQYIGGSSIELSEYFLVNLM